MKRFCGLTEIEWALVAMVFVFYILIHGIQSDIARTRDEIALLAQRMGVEITDSNTYVIGSGYMMPKLIDKKETNNGKR